MGQKINHKAHCHQRLKQWEADTRDLPEHILEKVRATSRFENLRQYNFFIAISGFLLIFAYAFLWKIPVILMVSILLAITAIILGSYDPAAKRRTANADGLVVGVTHSRHDNQVMYHPQYETVIDGHVIRFVASNGSAARPQVGSAVIVAYDPQEWNNIDFTSDHQRSAYFFVFFSGLTLLFSLFLLIVSYFMA